MILLTLWDHHGVRCHDRNFKGLDTFDGFFPLGRFGDHDGKVTLFCLLILSWDVDGVSSRPGLGNFHGVGFDFGNIIVNGVVTL